MGSNAGDHAYGLCLAVLGEPAAAEEAALAAVRRGGGRSVVTALAHARHCALAAATNSDAAAADPDEDLDDLPLGELAWRLSRTRPPVERAIADLHSRHGLDRIQFGRVLGMAPVEAAAKASETERRWTAELDPALVAFLGPAECPRLGEILVDAGLYRLLDPPAAEPEPGVAAPFDPAGSLLDRPALLDSPALPARDTGPVAVATITGPQPALGEAPPALARSGPFTAAKLLDAVGPVHDHIAGCETCGDRVRTMVSVRELLVRTPLGPAPLPVQAAAAASTVVPRMWRPAQWPPPLEPRKRSWHRLVTIAVAVVVAAGAGGGAYALATRPAKRQKPNSVDALTKVPAVNALAIDGSDALSAGEIFTLANVSSHPLRWTASSQFPWLAVSPSQGVLGPGDRVDLSTSLQNGAPSDATTALVTITGDDGSATAVEVRASGQAPPQIDAAISGCTVTATIQSPLALSAVTLSWHPHGPASSSTVSNRATVNMTPQSGTYTAPLPPPTGPLDWWVTATDQAGNSSRSPTHEFALDVCPPAG